VEDATYPSSVVMAIYLFTEGTMKGDGRRVNYTDYDFMGGGTPNQTSLEESPAKFTRKAEVCMAQLLHATESCAIAR
jgi:hypothetical protein